MFRYVIESAPPHLLRRLDMSVLEVWACTADLYRKAQTRLTKTGLLLKATSTGAAADTLISVQCRHRMDMTVKRGRSPSTSLVARLPDDAHSSGALAAVGDDPFGDSPKLCTLILVALLSRICGGCVVVAVADAAVTVVPRTVKVAATFVETTVDVAASGVKSVTGGSEDKK